MKTENVHGTDIYYESGRPTLEAGIEFLKDKDSAEVQSLLLAAKKEEYKHESYFSDRDGNKFEIDFQDNKYILRYRD